MADSFVFRFLGSTVRDCHCRYKQSTMSDTGKTKLSPSMYMQNMIKICAAPAYWLLVVGARAAATDLATAMDNHCRNRSALVMKVVGKNQCVSTFCFTFNIILRQ